MRKALLIISFILIAAGVFAQQPFQYLNLATILEGDTVSNITLAPVYIVEQKKFKNNRAKAKHTRLVRYVKKVYPYAKLAGEKLQEYDKILRATESEREKKKIMKQVEKEIRAEYEDKLRNFTVGQGKILVKLIDRETNHSSYILLKELRGGVSAALWQGVGRLFGYNLKVKYDPKGKDRQIEQIVRLIEMGAI